MSEGLPAPIGREALDRILRRAAELQTSERDVGDGLTPDEVLALGREVGIPGRYLQQAMLEERTRADLHIADGLFDRIVGPATVGAQRVVAGDADALGRRLLKYIDEHELFCVQRQVPGRITWEPLGGMAAALRRSTAALGRGRRPFMLQRVDVLAATITTLEPGFAHVALTAEVRRLRGSHVGGATAVASMGAAATAVLITLGAFAPVALAVLPMAAGGAWGVLRSARPKLERVALGLERVLDELQHGTHAPVEPGRPSLVGLLADEVRRALKPGPTTRT